MIFSLLSGYMAKSNTSKYRAQGKGYDMWAKEKSKEALVQ